MSLPRLGLSARLTLITVALVLICQLVNAAILVQSERSLRRERFEAVTAERLVQAVRLMELAPNPGRRLARRPGVRLTDDPPGDGRPVTAAIAAVRAALAEQGLDDRGVDVRVFDEGRRRFVVAAVELRNGRWFNYRQPLPPSVQAPWRAIALQTALLTAALLIPAVWIGRRVATPLRDLTAAANGFLTSSPAPPLPAHGPPDIRELCRAFAELQRRILAALDEKSVMLGSLGHDLRTPLASLRIRVESVADDTLRAQMIASIETLDATLDDVLTFSRATSHEAFRDIRTDALIRKLDETYRERGLAIGSVEAMSLECSPQAVLRALGNLVENALVHGGSAHLSVARRDGAAVFVVCDRGPGLAEADLERMLMPFARQEPSRSRESAGAGLGLAIARAVAEAHGGSLHLENRPDGGLAATFTLPAMREAGPRRRVGADTANHV